MPKVKISRKGNKNKGKEVLSEEEIDISGQSGSEAENDYSEKLSNNVQNVDNSRVGLPSKNTNLGYSSMRSTLEKRRQGKTNYTKIRRNFVKRYVKLRNEGDFPDGTVKNTALSLEAGEKELFNRSVSASFIGFATGPTKKFQNDRFQMAADVMGVPNTFFSKKLGKNESDKVNNKYLTPGRLFACFAPEAREAVLEEVKNGDPNMAKYCYHKDMVYLSVMGAHHWDLSRKEMFVLAAIRISQFLSFNEPAPFENFENVQSGKLASNREFIQKCARTIMSNQTKYLRINSKRDSSSQTVAFIQKEGLKSGIIKKKRSNLRE